MMGQSMGRIFTGFGVFAARAFAGWAACVLLAVACSSDASTTNQTTGGPAATTDGSTVDVLALIRRNNDLAKSKYDLRCKHCPCGAFLDVSAEGEECQARVLETFPQIRDLMIEALECTIAVSVQEESCFGNAVDCVAVDACSEASKPARDGCDQLEGKQPDDAAAFSTAVQRQCNF